MSAYDNLKCVSIGTEKKMGFERDEFIERTEKQKMWLYTGGAFDRGCDRGDPCSNLNSNFQRAASQGVAADLANLRAYYSEIQADYIATGKYNPEVPASDNTSYHYLTEITFLDGQRVELKAGKILIGKSKGENGYEIVYYCNEYLRTHNVEPHYYKCSLSLGASAL